jgi:formamidopyrimidine-DNA glycosylase
VPELPEVEAICSAIAREVTGRKISGVQVRRAIAVHPQTPAAVARLAAGRTIERVRRRGKNIVLELSGGMAVRVHLRMTGELYVSRDEERTPAVRVVFELGGRRLVFRDARALGKVHVLTQRQLDAALEELGPEPLSREFSATRLVEMAARSRQPAKLFLMDQSRVAGLGNIYAAEALFCAGIHPAKPIHRVPADRMMRLHAAIQAVLREATRAAKREYRRPGTLDEGEGFQCRVYGRAGEPCLTCGRKIRRVPQGGRSTYYCPGCQR